MNKQIYHYVEIICLSRTVSHVCTIPYALSAKPFIFKLYIFQEDGHHHHHHPSRPRRLTKVETVRVLRARSALLLPLPAPSKHGLFNTKFVYEYYSIQMFPIELFKKGLKSTAD